VAAAHTPRLDAVPIVPKNEKKDGTAVTILCETAYIYIYYKHTRSYYIIHYYKRRDMMTRTEKEEEELHIFFCTYRYILFRVYAPEKTGRAPPPSPKSVKYYEYVFMTHFPIDGENKSQQFDTRTIIVAQ